MLGLCDEDGSGNGEVSLAADRWGSSEVCRCAYTLEDRAESNEGLDICVWEGVCACFARLGPSSSESCLEQINMSFFVMGNELEIAKVEAAEASFGEV